MLDKRSVTPFDALHAFFQERRRCGELDTGVEGDRVLDDCTCGAGAQTETLIRIGP